MAVAEELPKHKEEVGVVLPPVPAWGCSCRGRPEEGVLDVDSEERTLGLVVVPRLELGVVLGVFRRHGLCPCTYNLHSNVRNTTKKNNRNFCLCGGISI